ncbi:hypothetical protein V8E51_005524 [Hyaloscypha variabilis]
MLAKTSSVMHIIYNNLDLASRPAAEGPYIRLLSLTARTKATQSSAACPSTRYNLFQNIKPSPIAGAR